MISSSGVCHVITVDTRRMAGRVGVDSAATVRVVLDHELYDVQEDRASVNFAFPSR